MGLNLGLFLNVPTGVFGVLAGALYSVAGVAAFRDDGPSIFIPLAELAVGSFLSAVVAFTDVVYTPQFTFLPLGVAAMLAGVTRFLRRAEVGETQRR